MVDLFLMLSFISMGLGLLIIMKGIECLMKK